MTNRNYLGCAETAKLVRQALKESFPGVKFSVRSDVYSGGASIDVRYTDGPNARQVESVAKTFCGGYFDGMIDYKGCNYHELDGQPTRFGADFIFVERTCTDALVDRAIAFLRGKYPSQVSEEVTAANYRAGKLYNVFPIGGDWSHNNAADAMIRQALAKITDRAGPAESATLARVKFAGDDGYGANTVGTAADPDTGKGYPRARSNAPEAVAESVVATLLVFPEGSKVLQ